MRTSKRADRAMVWGNCQAAPLASLLRGPLTTAGLTMVTAPPVYLVSDEEMRRLHELVGRCQVLVTQPIREDLFGPGRGSETLIEALPRSATVVQIPVAFHVGAFPWQVHAHGGDGERVAAPLTVYHDLRTICSSGAGAPDPRPLHGAALRAVAAASTAELRRREAGLDVATSDLLSGPDALWTMSHPTNNTLAEIARRILAVLRGRGLDVGEDVDVPDREYLGACRTPLERAVADAHGWPSTAVRPDWTLDGRATASATVATAHRGLYERRPDVLADARVRYADRIALLELGS